MMTPRYRALALALSAMALASSSLAEKAAPSFSVKGSVFCVDCAPSYDYSGVRVSVTCDQMTKKPLSLSMTVTKKDGSFEWSLPAPSHGSPARCEARLLGSPTQLFALRKNMVSSLVEGSEANTFTTSTGLKFAKACSTLAKSDDECGALLRSSKTVDLPVPPEYGLPPTSYYLPVLPIIGIP